ncbi:MULTISPECIES: ATP-binding protein [unclassified Duganella]|uniref:ATP-binding protein n=1 Tax=unclassified Duganella TaxID=2636909 RepID=UPI00088E1D44|nr:MULTISPECIES: ATP-binding protein [unclassified Duganella]SDG66360.1 PAS domain S-box-containing protein [Duganella sp. OV458]SDJ91602.1 PAS domain S-box-containing protein [Duganella sp. OV510]
MSLSLRAKFLMLSAVIQALVVGLLIWNSLRLMNHAVNTNAERVAQEYAVTLNLSLSPYATRGRLPELNSYLAEMLADPDDSFLRYLTILDDKDMPIIAVGKRDEPLPPVLRDGGGASVKGVRTLISGATLHARSPLLLADNRIGSINFGLTTRELKQARDEVLVQGSVIALIGFALGVLMFYVFTRGIGHRLAALTGESKQMASGDYSKALPVHGDDEIAVFTHTLNAMSAALRERIAQLEQSQRRLSESEARFKTLFDMAPLPLTVSDRDGRIVAANRAVLHTFGPAAGNLVGKRSDEVSFWASTRERERIWEMYRDDGAVHGAIAGVLLPDGSVGSVAIWSSTLMLDGKPSIIWALLDLTEELNAKRELKDLNVSLESRVRDRSAALERVNTDLSAALETLQHTQHELLASEKMASLGSLVAGIAHELNTPIGNSLLASTALRDRVHDFERHVAAGALRRSELSAHLDEVRTASELIAGSLHKAAELISSFKQIAVDQTNDQRRQFDLLAAVQDSIATYMPRLRRVQCDVALRIPAGLLLDSYPGGLYQVLTNLLTNALTHAYEHRRDGRIDIRAELGADDIIDLQFSDDGCGMTEDVQRHVFDPFFTTKMGQGGTGLGMNIVYNIVTGVLGGRIHLDSAPGVGTTIRLLIPRTAPQH